jgi:hypothetical protein
MPIYPDNCVMQSSEQVDQAVCLTLEHTCTPECNPQTPFCSEPCKLSDAAVIALGTVDAGNAACPGELWELPAGELEPVIAELRYQGSRVDAAGGLAFYTLPSPIADISFLQGVAACPEPERMWEESILALNNRIRHELPRERIIDFHSGISDPSDYIAYPCSPSGCPCPCIDAAHLNDDGQTKRARAAMSKLKN